MWLPSCRCPPSPLFFDRIRAALLAFDGCTTSAAAKVLHVRPATGHIGLSLRSGLKPFFKPVPRLSLCREMDAMHVLTRSLYRKLAPELAEPASPRAHEFLLGACDRATNRLLMGENLPGSKPARSLFREIRHLFLINDQETVLAAVHAHIQTTLRVGASLKRMRRRNCQAFSRKGAPCKRETLPGSMFCPSHKHLVETHDLEPAGAEHSFELML